MRQHPHLRLWSQPVGRVVLVTLAMAVLLLAALAFLRSASASTSGESVTVTLWPGANLIGWLEPNRPVSQVFERIPALQSISDGTRTTQRRDTSGTQPSPAPLRLLETGRGYWFTISGAARLEWTQFPAVRASDAALAPGRQLVAWGGRNEIRFESILLGLSGAVERAWNWDPASQRFRVWSAGSDEAIELVVPRPGASRQYRRSPDSRLSPGHGFGLIARHALSWRQPTGRTPRITFLGDVPAAIRAQARVDAGWVVSYFAESFGLEAEPDLLEIVIAATPEDVFGPDQSEWPENATAASIPADPFKQPTQILMPMQEWAPRVIDPLSGDAVHGRLVLLHEYYHALQAHLAGPALHAVPDWLIEAGPTWLQGRLRPQTASDQLQLEVAARYRLGLDPIPYQEGLSAQDLALGVSPTHAVGHAVTLWLHERFGADAHMRLWRTFQRRDLDGSDWRAVFEASYAISAAEMFSEYADWIGARFQHIEGVVIAPARLSPVELYLSLDGPTALPGARIALSQDGSFRVPAAVGGRYRFAVASADHRCSAYLRAAQIDAPWPQTTFVQVGPGGVDGVVLRVPEDFCQGAITGRLVGPQAAPVADLRLLLCDRDSSCAETTTSADGGFRLLAPGAGAYTLTIAAAEGGCARYYRAGRTVSRLDTAERIVIEEQSLTELRVQVPRPFCGLQIRGRLTGLPAGAPRMHMVGIPDNELRLLVVPSHAGGQVEAEIAADGSFVARVAEFGRYRLRLGAKYWLTGQPQEDCSIEYRYGRYWLRSEVELTEEGHEPIVWQVPPDMCKYTVSGVLTDQDGTPLPGLFVQACQYSAPQIGSQCGASVRSGPRGEFSLFVPYRGELAIALGSRSWPDAEPDRCAYDGAQGFFTRVEAPGVNVSGVRLSVPREVVCLLD